jgi:hypothetical protein
LLIYLEVFYLQPQKLRELLEIQGFVLHYKDLILGDDFIEQIQEDLRQFFEILLKLLLKTDYLPPS